MNVVLIGIGRFICFVCVAISLNSEEAGAADGLLNTIWKQGSSLLEDRKLFGEGWMLVKKNLPDDWMDHLSVPIFSNQSDWFS